MIEVSRLNGKTFVVNCEWIKFLESTPDTVITLTTGDKIMVRESIDEIIQKTMDYKRKISQGPEVIK